jgi:hypothetical protein
VTAPFAVGRARSRVRLPLLQRHQEARLTRLFRGPVLDSALAAAAANAGIRAEAIVCVRRVRLQCVLTDAGDAALVDAWSTALAGAVLQAVRAGGDGVRVYRSRHAALLSMSRAAVRGDLTDAWAWAQAGIWPDAEATSPAVTRAWILDALIADPEAAPAIVADAAATAGRLDQLLTRELLPRWQRLADAIARCREAPSDGGALSSFATEPPRAGVPATIWHAAERTACDPDVAQVLMRIAIVVGAPSRPISRHRPESEPAAPMESSEPAAPKSESTGRAVQRSHARPGGEVTRGAAATPAPATEATAQAGPVATELDSEAEWAATGWGGLLFLIHVVREIDLPGRHRTGVLGEVSAGRSLRWVLHQLAVTLLGLDPADPAALAFAGLSPHDPAPTEGAPPPGPADSTALAALADEITAALRLRLQTPEITGSELMDRVCRRAARVVCDPGWIEIRLAQDEVRTDVRRAGLDLDPGWLSFLGVVVRFSYE